MDAPVFARLLKEFNAEFGDPAPALEVLTARFALLLDRDNVVGVVAEEGQPTGFALITLRPTPYHDGPLAALDELYVVPPLRGRGIGAAMMRFALGHLRAIGCGEMQITVDEGDVGARRFYEAHGFTNHHTPATQERMLCYVQDL